MSWRWWWESAWRAGERSARAERERKQRSADARQQAGLGPRLLRMGAGAPSPCKTELTEPDHGDAVAALTRLAGAAALDVRAAAQGVADRLSKRAGAVSMNQERDALA